MPSSEMKLPYGGSLPWYKGMPFVSSLAPEKILCELLECTVGLIGVILRINCDKKVDVFGRDNAEREFALGIA